MGVAHMLRVGCLSAHAANGVRHEAVTTKTQIAVDPY
jgi:hypothetical protein